MMDPSSIEKMLDRSGLECLQERKTSTISTSIAHPTDTYNEEIAEISSAGANISLEMPHLEHASSRNCSDDRTYLPDEVTSNQEAAHHPASSRPDSTIDFCYVCMATMDDAVFMPCMHGGNCLSCAKSILFDALRRRVSPKCPLCRQPIRALGQLEDLSTSQQSSRTISNLSSFYQVLQVIMTVRHCHTR